MSLRSNKLNRRQFIKGAALTTVSLVAAGCAQPTATPVPPTKAPAAAAPTAVKAVVTVQPASFNWKRFSGTTLEVLLPEHPIWDYQRKKLPEFEALTGIKVNSTSTPASTQYAKTLLQLTTAPEKAEVYLMVPVMQWYKYMKEGFIEDLNKYIKNPELVAPDWDAADLMSGPMSSLVFKGIQGGLPLYVHDEVLWYRRSLYEKKGLKPPETFDDLLKNAQALHDPTNKLYGFAMRGIGSQATWPWSQWLYGYGGKWATDDMKAAFAGPEGIEAAKMYGKIMREFGPPGPTEIDDGRYNTLWKEGNLGQMTQALHYASSYVDPKTSKITDDMACAPYPGGPKGKFPLAVGVGFSMSSKSPHKEASWYYMMWATSKQMVNAYQNELGQASCRTSAWKSPEFAASPYFKIPGFMDTLLKQLSSSQLAVCLPPAEDVQAARDLIGVALTTAIQGGDVEGAMKTAAQKYEKLLAGTPITELMPPAPTAVPTKVP